MKEEIEKNRSRYRIVADKARAIRKQIHELEAKLYKEERELQMLEYEYSKYMENFLENRKNECIRDSIQRRQIKDRSLGN